MLHGCDIASYQTVETESKYSPDFVIVKCSEGISYINPLYHDQIAWARDNHKLVMHYHFAQSNDSTYEADYFLHNIDLRPGELVCLDMEVGGLNPSRAAWTLDWLNYVESKLNMRPVLYLNQNWATQLGNWVKGLKLYPLWIAHYIKPEGNPNLCGWSVWTFQQYTSTPIDLDVFNGDATTWAKLADTGIMPPTPVVVKPPAPVVTKPPAIMVPVYPLPAKHYFGMESSDTYCHSGWHGQWASSIRLYQNKMYNRGWKAMIVDGSYGKTTESITRQFQTEKHLTVDGRVGPQTWNAAWKATVT